MLPPEREPPVSTARAQVVRIWVRHPVLVPYRPPSGVRGYTDASGAIDYAVRDRQAVVEAAGRKSWMH